MNEPDSDDDRAFEIFANCYPHEAYATEPERFWAHFQKQCPGVSRAEMERLLKDMDEDDDIQTLGAK